MLEVASFSYPFATLQQLAEDVLKHARDKGATASEVDVSEGFGQSVGVRCDEVETIEFNRDKGVGITVYVGQRKGYASTSDFSPQALRETVEAALDIARFTAEDDCAGLADAALMAKDCPDLDLYHPWALTVEDAIETARRCEQAAFDASPLVSNSEGASVSTQQAHFVSANSLGFMGGYPTSRHYISCSVIAGEQDAMQRDDWYTTRRCADELDDPALVGRTAALRAVARLGGRKVKTGEFPVLFEAPLAAGLLGSLVHAASGGALYRKSSFLVDHLGKRVMPEFINVSERPHIKRGLGSSAFDSDGVATREREVVSGGILQGYFLSAYTARKLGMQTTGNAGGSHNLIIEPGTRPDEANEPRPAGHRTARPRDQLRDRRLLARRRRLLGRERQDRLPGRGNHHCRQSQGYAARDRRRRQRCASPRFETDRLDTGRPHDRGRRVVD